MNEELPDITEYQFEKGKVLALSNAFRRCLLPSDYEQIYDLLDALQSLVPPEVLEQTAEGLPPLLEEGEMIRFGENILAYILSTDHGYQLHFDEATDPIEATQQFINYLTDHPDMVVRGFSARVTMAALERLYKQLVTVSFHTTFVPLFTYPESTHDLITVGMIESATVDQETGNVIVTILDEDDTEIETVITPKDLISELLRAIYPYTLHTLMDHKVRERAISRLSMTFQRVKIKEG